MAAKGTVSIKILGDADQFSRTLSKAGGDAESFGHKMGGLGTIIGGALAGGAVLKFGDEAVKAFDESEQSQSKLSLALRNNPATVGVNASAFGDLNKALAQHTLADDDVIASTEARMATFGMSKKQIEQNIPVVLDLAAKLGVDAPEAADVFDKASKGSLKALKSLGIEFKPTGDRAKDLAKIHDLLAQKTKGAAQAQLDAAGPGEKLKKHMDELFETVGGLLVPVLEKASVALQKVADFVGKVIGAFQHGGMKEAVGLIGDAFEKVWPQVEAALGNLLSAFGNWIVSDAVPFIKTHVPPWAEALWSWIKDVTPPALAALGEFLGNIGGWILNPGLPMLGRALVELGKALWHFIQDSTGPALGQLVDWMAQLGSWILGTGIPRLAGFMANLAVKLVDWISDVVPQIPGKLGELLGKVAAWVVIEGVPGLIKFSLKMSEALVGFIADAAKAAPGKLADMVGAIAGWLKDKGPGLLADGANLMAAAISAPFKFAFNTIAGFWNNTVGKISFSVPSWVPGLGGKGFDFPKITPLASGGIVTRPTLAMIGEAGPEAVLPLSRGFGGRAGSGTTVAYSLVVNALDPRAAGDTVIGAIVEFERRNGSSWRN